MQPPAVVNSIRRRVSATLNPEERRPSPPPAPQKWLFLVASGQPRRNQDKGDLADITHGYACSLGFQLLTPVECPAHNPPPRAC